MSAIAPPKPAPPPKPGIDAFHRERSKCIDAFALLEERIITLLEAREIKPGTASFGQKIEKLKKHLAAKPPKNGERQAMAELVAAVEGLIPFRNDLVHSRLQIATIGDEHRACLINTRECSHGSQSARLLTLDGLRKITREVAQLADGDNVAA